MPCAMEGPSWTQRIDQRARQFGRWASRHWIFTGLLIAAALAGGVYLRWRRYDRIFGDSPGATSGDLIELVPVFAALPPACLFIMWRASRRLHTRSTRGATHVELSGRHFDLVATNGELQFDGEGWTRARSLLVELVPANRVSLVGEPPTRIRVEPWGLPEVAPDVLTRLEELAGVPLRVEIH